MLERIFKNAEGSDAADRHAVLEELFKSLLHKLMTGEVRVGELALETLSDSTLRSRDKGYRESMSDVFDK